MATNKGSRESINKSRDDIRRSVSNEIVSKLGDIPKRKLVDRSDKPIILPKGLIDAIKGIPVLNTDEFILDLNDSYNKIANTVGDCNNDEAIIKESEKTSIPRLIGSIDKDRLQKISSKQAIRKALVEIKFREELNKATISDKKKDIAKRGSLFDNKKSLREIESDTKKIVSGLKSGTIDFKNKIASARNFNRIVDIENVPEEDTVCKPTTIQESERTRELGKQTKATDSLIAESLEDPKVIEAIEATSINQERLTELDGIKRDTKTEDERLNDKNKGQDSADNLIKAALGTVVVLGLGATAMKIIFKSSNPFIKQQAELDSMLTKIQEISDQNKEFMDSVQVELEAIPTYLDDYFHSWVIMDYLFTTLLLRFKLVNQLDNIDLYLRPFIENAKSQIDDGVERESPMSQAVVDKTIEKLNRYTLLIDSLQPNGPEITSLNAGAKKNDTRQIVSNSLESLSDKSSISVDDNIVFDYNVGASEKTSGSLKQFLDITSREPTQQEAEQNSYVENIYNETKAYYETTMMGSVFPNLENQVVSASQIAHRLLSYYGNLTNFLNKFTSYTTKVINHSKDLRDSYEFTYSKYNEKRIREQLAEAGQQLNTIYGSGGSGGGSGSSKSSGQTLKESANSNKSLDDFLTSSPPETFQETNANYTFGAEEDATIEQTKYWGYWASILNIVTLAPSYWTTGIILPSPAGPKRINLPIFWIPLVVIPTPFAIAVVWLTINGIVVTPTVWMITFKPLPEAISKHVTLFRGGNKEVKSDKTETKTILSTISGGLDIAPLAHLGLPLIKDDIPTSDRLKITNDLWVKYLQKWCEKAKQSMGLP